MFPVASDLMAPLVLWLSVIAIIYASPCGDGARRHEKARRLFLGRAHMGFVTMGIFAANQQGVDGAIFQMISHGFISGALFLCAWA
jgi:NADH-quinone oxidoreductase subunit M